MRITWILAVSYQGTLTASLAIPTFEEPIDSLTDFLDAADKRGYKPVVAPGSSNEFIFLVRVLSIIFYDIWIWSINSS